MYPISLKRFKGTSLRCLIFTLSIPDSASNLDFHVPHIRSNYGKHIFKFAITKIWEEIPNNIKTFRYYQFKNQYKRILLNSQS